MKAIKAIRNFFNAAFAKPSAELLAMQELEDAKRELLEAQTGRDYAMAIVAYNEQRIERLTAYVQNCTKPI